MIMLDFFFAIARFVLGNTEIPRFTREALNLRGFPPILSFETHLI